MERAVKKNTVLLWGTLYYCLISKKHYTARKQLSAQRYTVEKE